VHARDLLGRLGAVAEGDRITQMGRQMAAIPLHPRLSRFLLEASHRGVEREAARIAAALSEGRLRLGEHGRKHFVSDLDAILDAETPVNVRRLEEQIARPLPRCTATDRDPHALEKAVLHGYPDRVGRRRGDTVLLSSAGSARLDRASAVEAEFVCAIEIEERTEHGMPVIRIASPIEPDWLLEFFPEHVQTRDELRWNRAAERVEQVSALLYDSLVIDESAQAPSDRQAAGEMVAEKALEAGIERFTDKTSLDRLLARIHFAQQHTDALQPDEGLVEKALRQLAYGARSFSELIRVSGGGALEQIVESILPMALLDEIAPTHIKLPGGRRARIEYSQDQNPWVASRLQDFFGMRETPRVARGTVPLVIHLLAPNHRPVQMTKDLASFWKNLYPQVRRELSRRYPKHKWPEDPYQPAA
jgi:ATP-dependent helicase HrpB